MDETDFVILKKLMENCRVTFRELSEIIGMSVSSTHKRINKLVDDGVIKRFFARPSALALKYLPVLIYGTSSAKSLDVVSKELGQHECVENVAIATGKIVYISGILRDLSELRDYSTFVSKTAQISEPFVGIINIPYITSPEPLTTIDYRILKALNKDARKPITDVADEVGLTAKTVKKRLDRMIENYLVEISIQMEAEYNLVTGFHIYLKEGANIDKIVQDLSKKYGQTVIGILNYSNVPNFLSFYIWTITLQDSQKINEELHDMGFNDIIPFIFLNSNFYDTWVEQLLRTK